MRTVVSVVRQTDRNPSSGRSETPRLWRVNWLHSVQMALPKGAPQVGQASRGST